MTSDHHQYITAKMIRKPGATIHQLTALKKPWRPPAKASAVSLWNKSVNKSECMPTAAPSASRKAPSAPSAGHGLGSTRWYGCFGAPCESAMVSAPFSVSAGGQAAEQGLGPLRLRLVESVR